MLYQDIFALPVLVVLSFCALKEDATQNAAEVRHTITDSKEPYLGELANLPVFRPPTSEQTEH